MKENGVIRRRLSGKEADPYIGLGRKILGEMKNIMQMGGIKQLNWTKDLQNGVRIVVSSIMGQDEVRIFVPVYTSAKSEKRTISNTYKTKNMFIYSIVDGTWRWSRNKGWETFDGWNAFWARAVSGNGKMLVGSAPYNNEAMAWTESKGVYNLGFRGDPHCVSEDGSVIAGNSYYASNQGAWVFNSDGLQFILDSPAFSYAMSRDGKIIVGNKGSENQGSFEAWLWTKESGVEIIGDFYVTGISADGSTVIGFNYYEDPYWGQSIKGVVWTRENGSVDLPYGNGSSTQPRAVSKDGSTVVGTQILLDDEGYIFYYAFKWTAAAGIKLLWSRFEFSGERSNITAAAALDVSDDGRFIVGTSRYSVMLWDNEAAEELGSEHNINLDGHGFNASEYGYQDILISIVEKEYTEEFEIEE